jgi:hypothetical protein
MADVFVSYKREDRARAAEIANAIRAQGYSVFFDVEIDVGDSWDARIERELAEARCVVVLWSPRSRDSRWVRNEARDGQGRRVLAPVIIDHCKVPIEFSDVQATDLSDWRGDVRDPRWVNLIERIADCVRRPAAAASGTAPAMAAPPRRGGVSPVWIVAGAILAAGALVAVALVGVRPAPTHTAAIAPPTGAAPVADAPAATAPPTQAAAQAPSQSPAQSAAPAAPATPRPALCNDVDPLVLWWNPSVEDNFTTTDRAGAHTNGYFADRIDGYLAREPGPGMVAVNTYYSRARADYFLSTLPRPPREPDYVFVRREGYAFTSPPGHGIAVVPLINRWHAGRTDNFATTLDGTWTDYEAFRTEGYVYATCE